MKRKLCKLPKRKEYELHKIVETVRKYTDIEMVILFGSYARGDFVERDVTFDEKTYINYEYISDFDILIVLKEKDLPNPEVTERRIQARINRVKQIATPTTVIVHSAEYINEKLAQRQYFFCDLIKEGVALYDSGKIKLAPSRKLTLMEEVKLVVADFKHWDKTANGFYKQFEFALARNENNIAAFELHQATERWYHMVWLVFTRDKKKTHDIEVLGNLVAIFDLEFKTVFPREPKEKKICFELLKDAYIDARYNYDYKITKKQLDYLAGRVRKLRAMARRICRRKIDELKQAAP